MAPPLITVHNAAGAVISAPIVLPTATPGTPTAETVVSVRNNAAAGPAVDPLRDGRLSVLAVLAGSLADPVGDGLNYLAARALQVRVSTVSGGATATITGWRPIGVNRTLSIGEIPDGGIVTLGLRTSASLAAALADVELSIVVEGIQSTPLPDGAYELAGNFVYDGRPGGIADPAFTEVLTTAGALDPGTADDTVDIWTSVAYTLAGVARTFSPSPATITFNDQDGAAAALASGEAYYAAITLDGTDTPVVTKGLKSTAPLASTDKPTPPAGQLLAGFVVVPFGLAIDTVEDLLELGHFGLTVVAGLQVEVGRGRAAVGGRWVHTQTSTSITLPDGQTSTIYRQPESGLEVVEASVAPTEALSMPIFDVVTSGGVVTSTTDRRRIGSERRARRLWSVTFVVDAAAAGSQTVHVTARDGLGQALDHAVALEWYLSDTADGLTPTASAPVTGVAEGAAGQLVERPADVGGLAVTTTAGLADLVISHAVSAVTWYLVVIVAGRLHVSGAITPTP